MKHFTAWHDITAASGVSDIVTSYSRHNSLSSVRSYLKREIGNNASVYGHDFLAHQLLAHCV